MQLKGFDAAHYRRTEGYARQIDRLCSLAASDYAQLAGTLFQPDLNKPFDFNDYPQAKREAQQIAAGLAKRIEGVVIRGTDAEWRAACDKNDAFLKSILRTSRLTPEEAEQYQARNLEALQSFQQRKVEGLGLSQRVWKYVGDIKDTIELGIDVGLGEGRSAAQLSRDLRQCLQEPDRLFRRVRDKYGNLQLSKAAKLYHPGQGVYRSSAKNAMRLARTEVNMAYRQAEYLRWQQLDFVVGLRVMLSNNHTVLDSKGKPQPLVDICDDLAGDYPKTFRFEGWHPQCRCFVVPILSDYDEYNKGRADRLKAIVRGETYKAMPSRRTVTALPENFTRHIEQIAERSKGWKSQPYYIRHNFQGGKIEGGLKPGVASRMNGATEKPTQKPQPQPCTEFDTALQGLKRWAYTFGLDLTTAERLRLEGKRNELEAEVERLDELRDKRFQQWADAHNAVYLVVQQMQAKHFTKLADAYYKQLTDLKMEPSRYYGDCIPKLATLKAQAEADLAKAIAEEAKQEYSQLMPADFKKGGDYLDGEDYIFDKRFFDMLKETPKLDRPHTNKGSYETNMGRKVVLDSDDRSKRSPWEKKSVVYHEFGHAIADQRGLTTSQAVIDLREAMIKRLRVKVKTTVQESSWDYTQHKYTYTTREANLMKAKVISARIDAVLARIRKFGDEVFTRRGITKHDVIEQIGCVQDTLKSLINSPGVGWGHSTSYFKSQYLRRHEFLAHCFENAFLGNRVFQHFMPTEYQEMIDLINGLKFS